MESFKSYLLEAESASWIKPSGEYHRFSSTSGEHGEELANMGYFADAFEQAFKDGLVRTRHYGNQSIIEFNRSHTKAAINASNHLTKYCKGKSVSVTDADTGHYRTFKPHEHQQADLFILGGK